MTDSQSAGRSGTRDRLALADIPIALTFFYPNRCSANAITSNQNMPTAQAKGPTGWLRKRRRIATAVGHIANTRMKSEPTRPQKRNGSILSTSRKNL